MLTACAGTAQLSSSHRALPWNIMFTKRPLALPKLSFQCTLSTLSLSLEGELCCSLSSCSSVASMEGNGRNIAPGVKGLLCALAGDADIYFLQSPLKFGTINLQILAVVTMLLPLSSEGMKFLILNSQIFGIFQCNLRKLFSIYFRNSLQCLLQYKNTTAH